MGRALDSLINHIDSEIIKDGNKLIAEFMGAEILEMAGMVYCVFSKTKQPWVTDLKYHESWDWLMPVVEKIETVEGFDMNEIQYHTESGHSMTIYMDSDDYAQQRRVYAKSKIEAAYKAIVEFIEWHNEQQTPSVT